MTMVNYKLSSSTCVCMSNYLLKYGYSSSIYFDTIHLILSNAFCSMENHINLTLTDFNLVYYLSVCGCMSHISI